MIVVPGDAGCGRLRVFGPSREREFLREGERGEWIREEGPVVEESKLAALAVLAEVASWDRSEETPEMDLCWSRDGVPLIMKPS